MARTVASAEVLGRLLVLQQTLDVLSDVGQISAFLRPMLQQVPGITDARLLVPDPAPAEGADATLRFPVATDTTDFGCIQVDVDLPEEFAPYEPFVTNIGHQIATILENRASAASLAAATARLNSLVVELDDRVAARTRDLQAANDALLADEAALEAANRSLQTLSVGDHALVHAESESELVEGIVDAIVTTGGYPAAFVAVATDPPPGEAGGWVVTCLSGDAVTREEVTAWLAGDGGGPAADAGHGPGPAIRCQVPGDSPALAGQRVLLAGLRQPSGPPGILAIVARPNDASDTLTSSVLETLADDLAYGLERQRDARKLSEGLSRTIMALGTTIEVRDPYTAGHQRRVSEIAAAIATRLGWAPFDVEGVKVAASIHDIGKIAIPSEILTRPGRLTDLERAMVMTHSQVGADIVRDIQFPWPVAEMIRQHHERLDGSGYPRALEGSDIVPGARIIAVADVFEAITHHRPYRVGLGEDEACAELARGRGLKYDADAVDAHLALLRDGSLPGRDDDYSGS